MHTKNVIKSGHPFSLLYVYEFFWNSLSAESNLKSHKPTYFQKKFTFYTVWGMSYEKKMRNVNDKQIFDIISAKNIPHMYNV